MRTVSRKRAAQMRQYRPLVAEFLEARPRCEFPEGCDQRAVDVHHRKGRSGEMLLLTEHWSALCRRHHDWVTVNPAASYDLGVSERRTGRTA